MMTTTAEPRFWGMFPDRINPLADETERGTLAWSETMRLLDDEPARDRITRSAIGLGVARAYPNATAEVLALAADAILWLTALDDVHGEASCADPAALVERVGGFLRILADPHSCTATTGFDGALRDIVLRSAQHTTPPQTARIHSALRDALFAIVWEAHVSPAADRVSMDDYLVMRRHLSFAGVVLAFTEPANRMELPQHQRFAPAVVAAEIAVANVLSWVNDVFSFQWEQEHGNALNLVALIARDRQLDLGAARNVAARMCDDEARLVLRLTEHLSAAPDALLRNYADTLQAVVASTNWYRFHSHQRYT